MKKNNSDKIADICQWLGTDAFLYLQIMEVFRHADVAANNSNIADDMNDCLHKFHGYCKQIIEKNQH